MRARSLVTAASKCRPALVRPHGAGRVLFLSSEANKADVIEPKLQPPPRWAQRIAQVFGFGKTFEQTRRADMLLQSCIVQANNTIFYRAGRVSESFRSHHGLLCAHIWMVHKRLLLEGDEGKALEEKLFDRLWDETVVRIRALKVNELSVNSYLKEVQAYSFGACVSYDATQAIENEAERLDELAGALYRYVYLRDENLTEEHVLKLAKYVQSELDSIKTLPRDAVFDARFKWGKPPSWKPSRPGQLTSGQQQAPEEEAELGTEEAVDDGKAEWRTAFTESGRMYYWNVRTRESTWEKPY